MASLFFEIINFCIYDARDDSDDVIDNDNTDSTVRDSGNDL